MMKLKRRNPKPECLKSNHNPYYQAFINQTLLKSHQCKEDSKILSLSNSLPIKKPTLLQIIRRIRNWLQDSH